MPSCPDMLLPMTRIVKPDLTPTTARVFVVDSLRYFGGQLERPEAERSAACALLCRLEATCTNYRTKESRKLVRVLNTMLPR